MLGAFGIMAGQRRLPLQTRIYCSFNTDLKDEVSGKEFTLTDINCPSVTTLISTGKFGNGVHNYLYTYEWGSANTMYAMNIPKDIFDKSFTLQFWVKTPDIPVSNNSIDSNGSFSINVGDSPTGNFPLFGVRNLTTWQGSKSQSFDGCNLWSYSLYGDAILDKDYFFVTITREIDDIGSKITLYINGQIIRYGYLQYAPYLGYLNNATYINLYWAYYNPVKVEFIIDELLVTNTILDGTKVPTSPY